MKVFGYVQKQCSDGLVELSEVTFQGAPEKLRHVASFLLKAATEMETHGARFDHLHIRDEVQEWSSRTGESPDVIAAR